MCFYVCMIKFHHPQTWKIFISVQLIIYFRMPTQCERTLVSRARPILSTDDAQNVLSTLRTQEWLLVHSRNGRDQMMFHCSSI